MKTEKEEIAWRRDLEAIRLEIIEQQGARILELEATIKSLYQLMHTIEDMPAYKNWPVGLWYAAASIANE